MALLWLATKSIFIGLPIAVSPGVGQLWELSWTRASSYACDVIETLVTCRVDSLI